MRTHRLSYFIILVLIPMISLAQIEFSSSNKTSSITIQGTSSLHDWEETVNEFTMNGTLDENTISNLKLTIVTKSIVSNKSSIMDDKTHEALKAKKHPQIILTGENLVITSDSQIEGMGQLLIAGVQKSIPIKAKLLKSDDKMKVSGQVELVMSAYGIDPPTAMFGTLTTGDKVTITYEILLQPNETTIN